MSALLTLALQPGHLAADPMVSVPAATAARDVILAAVHPSSASPVVGSGMDASAAPFFCVTDLTGAPRTSAWDRGPWVYAHLAEPPPAPPPSADAGTPPPSADAGASPTDAAVASDAAMLPPVTTDASTAPPPPTERDAGTGTTADTGTTTPAGDASVTPPTQDAASSATDAAVADGDGSPAVDPGTLGANLDSSGSDGATVTPQGCSVGAPGSRGLGGGLFSLVAASVALRSVRRRRRA